MSGQGKEFWLPHLAALESQGKPMTVYAREQGLSVSALGWWHRKVRKRTVVAQTVKPAFVSLKVAEPAAIASLPVTLSLGDEVRLQLPTLPNVQWLAALGKAMRDER